MKKILIGLALIVFLGSVMYVTYGVSKKNQMAAVYSSRASYGYGYGNSRPIQLKPGVFVGTGDGRPKKYEKCPCSKEYLRLSDARIAYDKQDKLVNDLDRENFRYRSKPNTKPATFDDQFARAKDDLKDYQSLLEESKDAMKACMEKPENKELYKKGPPQGRCYDEAFADYYDIR